jgi:hypothetical protein
VPVRRKCAWGPRCRRAAELATALPVDIVVSAVGLPPEGRERVLIWAEQMFNCFGPLNGRARTAFPVLQEMRRYATTQAVRGKLKPGSWAEAIIDAVDRGEVDEAARPVMMIDYMGPSLDTTIYAIGRGVWLFARNPPEWGKVCQAPFLVASAVNEILRLEAPIQGFFPAFDTGLRYGWNCAPSRLASHRVLRRGKPRRAKVSAPEHIRCEARVGGAARVRLGTPRLSGPAFGKAGDECDFWRLGEESEALPYRGGGPQHQQRPARLQQTDRVG